MKRNNAWALLTTVVLILGNDPQGTNGAETKNVSKETPSAAFQKGWEVGNQADVAGLQVTLSKPVLVARSGGYLWFPSVTRLSSSDLMAMMSDHADAHLVTELGSTGKVTWSSDGGLNWSPLTKALYGDGSLTLPNGDQLFMPYYLRPVGEGKMGAPCQICPKGEHLLKVVKPGVTIEGWPRPDKSLEPKAGLSGFVCNGQVIPLKDNKGYLATLYGFFRETDRSSQVVEAKDRFSLVASESSDGVRWEIRAVIADETCPLGGRGACESAMARLKDGRLLCVFRVAQNYGHCFSSDEGRTWTKPTTLQGAFSVEPSLAVMPDGLIALSGGRPGLFLWLNPDGTAATWHKIDVLANHNKYCPEHWIKASGLSSYQDFGTSSYTEIIPLDDHHLLYIYDRIPYGWRDSPSIWVVRVTVTRALNAPPKPT